MVPGEESLNTEKTLIWIFSRKTLYAYLCKSFDTHSTGIWIIHSNNFNVSNWVVLGYEFLATESTGIMIFPSMTLHVNLFGSLIIIPCHTEHSDIDSLQYESLFVALCGSGRLKYGHT